jgi:hypothetical protein
VSGFASKSIGRFSTLASKPVTTVSSGLASKPVVTVSAGLTSKSATTVFAVLASKPVATVFSSLASKLAGGDGFSRFGLKTGGRFLG